MLIILYRFLFVFYKTNGTILSSIKPDGKGLSLPYRGAHDPNERKEGTTDTNMMNSTCAGIAGGGQGGGGGVKGRAERRATPCEI
jgi:hypothetical protein